MTYRLRLVLGGLIVATATVAQAFNYTNSDLMLVFRKDGFNDTVFDLGTVSNYLGKANGTTLTVANWNLSLAKSTYGNNLSGVKFILIAATSMTGEQSPLRVWATDASITAATAPTDMPPSKWGGLRSTISTVGTEASAITATNSTQSYVVSSTDPSSYTYVASGGNQYDVATMSGYSPFPVESAIPATQLFYELKPSSATPKPAAALVGSFQLATNGVLTFTAGPLVQQVPQVPARIVSWQRNGSTTTLQFTTTNSLNYRLWYLNQLATPWTWASNATLISGDGSNKTITDTYTGNTRFYRIETLH